MSDSQVSGTFICSVAPDDVLRVRNQGTSSTILQGESGGEEVLSVFLEVEDTERLIEALRQDVARIRARKG